MILKSIPIYNLPYEQMKLSEIRLAPSFREQNIYWHFEVVTVI